MNNYQSLLITYGKPHVPLAAIAKDYLAPMSDKTLKVRASNHQLPFPAFREDSQKGPWLVDLRDLAEYLDKRRVEALAYVEGRKGWEDRLIIVQMECIKAYEIPSTQPPP